MRKLEIDPSQPSGLSGHEEATLEGFQTCLAMVWSHIQDLEKEYTQLALAGGERSQGSLSALARLSNRIAEDTK